MKKCLSFILIIVLFLIVLFFISINTLAAHYTVQKGDTMWHISQKYGVTLNELIAANPQIANTDNIFVGLIINIPDKSSPTGKESLSYLYAGTTASYLKMLNTSNNSINTVCTDYFDINANGSLLITPSNKIDTAFIDAMHTRGILVTPFISNHWDKAKGNAALDNREGLSTEIVNMIEKYNLDGINIDIENVNEQYRQKYTDFTRLLRQKLPKEKVVTVAVAANPNGWNMGWHGSYDYKALSNYSDYLMIMAYDESYQGGPAGPVSSGDFFEKSIKYALNQGVPSNKIVAGLPFFGRYWKEGAATGGIGIAAKDVEYLVNNYNSEYQYNEQSQSANVIVTIGADEPKPMIWGGRVLSEGRYNIWYDDSKSVRHKLDIISDNGLKGAGSWALGQESGAIWSFYNQALNGGNIEPSPTPTATPTPAPISEKPSFERIVEILKESGDSREISSLTALTRGEVAVILSEICHVESEPDGIDFTDTVNHWGKGQINALRRRGIINGSGNNMFEPDNIVAREEIVAMLERILVLPNTIDFHELTFQDVTTSMWSYNSIAKLYYFSLVQGFSKDFFRPREGVDAGAVGIILDRIKKHGYPMNADKYIEQNDVSSKRLGEPNGFRDPIINPR